MAAISGGGWLKQLDTLLRGERTTLDALRGGIIDVPMRVFVPCAIGLGCIYGFFMGWFAMSNPDHAAWMQLIASTVKLPALFLLTLFVTFPSLYVFNALVGCRLGFRAALRLLVAAVVVNLAVGASLGPILAFFTLSTTSYPFIVLLNVLLLGIAGIVGLGFLLRTLQRIEAGTIAEAAMLNVQQGLPARAPDVETGAANGIFKVWVIIYALVGAQMGWLLRPFIGNPNMEFHWFRPREGNFFQSIFQHVGHLLGM
jgi:hypothetical protein